MNMKVMASLVLRDEEQQTLVSAELKKYPVTVGEEPGGIALFGTMDEDKALELVCFLEEAVKDRLIQWEKET